MDGLSGSHRSGPSGLHRRDLDQDQHGAIARLEPPRSAPAGQGAARPMDDHDLPCCPSPRSRRGALADRWPDRWRKLPPLHRPGAHPHPAARRHRHHGQPGLAQEQRHPTRPKGSRRQALLPAEVLAGSEPYRDALLKAQTRLAEGRQAHPRRGLSGYRRAAAHRPSYRMRQLLRQSWLCSLRARENGVYRSGREETPFARQPA